MLHCHEYSVKFPTDPYTPYKVTIRANTSVGEGEPSSIIVFFTSESGGEKICKFINLTVTLLYPCLL